MGSFWENNGKLVWGGGGLVWCDVCPCIEEGEPCFNCIEGTSPKIMRLSLRGVVMDAGGCECLDWNQDWLIPQDANPCRYLAAYAGNNGQYPGWPELPLPCQGAIDISLFTGGIEVVIFIQNGVWIGVWRKYINTPYNCKTIGDLPKYQTWPGWSCDFSNATVSLSG